MRCWWERIFRPSHINNYSLILPRYISDLNLISKMTANGTFEMSLIFMLQLMTWPDNPAWMARNLWIVCWPLTHVFNSFIVCDVSQKDVHHQIIGFSDLFHSPSSMKDFMWRCVTQKPFAIKPSGQIKFSILLIFSQKGKWNEFLFILLTEYQKESHLLDTQYVLINANFLNFGQQYDDASRSLNSIKCKLHFNSLFVLSFIESIITYAFYRFDKDN